jgi:hypothetical protein
LENVIIKFVADTSGLEPAIKQLELLGKISKEDAAAFAQVNNEQKEFIQNLNKSTTEMGKLSNEVEGLMSEIQGGVMEKFAENLSEVTSETKQAGTGFKSMKQELKELKAQIGSGSLGEKELKEATKRAAELQDKIGDVNDKVKALASDTKRIDAVVTAFKGIAAAASVAAGAAALFGGENEKLTKTLAQAQGAMALLTGIQEIAAIVTTENALKTFVLDGAQKAVAISARVMGTSIATATAVATAGLTLLLAGIAWLVTDMVMAVDETAKLDEKLANLGANKEIIEKNNVLRAKLIKDGRTRELAILLQGYQHEKDALLKSKADGELIEVNTVLLHKKYRQDAEEINAKYDKAELDAAKALADEKARITAKADAEALQAKLLNIRDLIAQNKLLMGQTYDTTERVKYSAEIIRLRKQQIDLDHSLTANEKILEKKNLDDSQRAYEESFNKRNESDLESWVQTNELKTENTLDWWEKYFETEKNFEDRMAAKRKENAKMWGQWSIDQAQVLSDTIFTINSNRLQAETDNLLSALDTQRDAELSNKNLTDAQRLQIEKRYQEQEAQIKLRAWEAQKEAAIAQAIINGALTISKTLAEFGFTPAAIPAVAGAAIATAAQLAIINSTQPPKFADGTEFLVGAGTGRSDSNLAYLSHGERVVPAGVNSDYYPALSAIHNREVEPSFANNILTSLANGTFDLAAQFQSKQSYTDSGLDYERLSKVLERNKSSVHINLDEQGFNKHIIKESSKVSFRNSKLRIKQ